MNDNIRYMDGLVNVDDQKMVGACVRNITRQLIEEGFEKEDVEQYLKWLVEQALSDVGEVRLISETDQYYDRQWMKEFDIL